MKKFEVFFRHKHTVNSSLYPVTSLFGNQPKTGGRYKNAHTSKSTCLDCLSKKDVMQLWGMVFSIVTGFDNLNYAFCNYIFYSREYTSCFWTYTNAWCMETQLASGCSVRCLFLSGKVIIFWRAPVCKSGELLHAASALDISIWQHKTICLL